LTDRFCEAPHAQHKKYSAYPGPDGAKFAQGVIFFRHSAIDRMAMTDSGMVRPPTADQIGASEVSNGPRPGVVLRWAHEPRRHARHAHAHADASHSGIHTGGEECSMPAWLHSEWRLLHAYVPACSGPARGLPFRETGFQDQRRRHRNRLPNSISPLQRQSARTRPAPIGG
jgi:hypothetical protein